MIRYLKTWYTRFKDYTAEVKTIDDIAPSERISRYILSRRQFSRDKQRVKYAAFLPPPSLEMSVYRTDTLKEAEIWEIGKVKVADPQNKTIHARGDIDATCIYAANLSIVPDPQPHKLHANITAWPSEKSEQKMIAIELANAAKLFLPPP